MFFLLLACSPGPEPTAPDAPEIDQPVVPEPPTPRYTDCFVDADGDGSGGEPVTLEGDACTPGTVASGGDCDDADARRTPGQVEVCDTLDNDCDGDVDSPVPADAPTWFADADGDGFGDPAAALQACDAPAGYLVDATDCDDTSDAAYPGGVEACEDGLDNDCAGDGDGLCRIEGDWAAADARDAVWLGETERDGFGYGVAAVDLDLDGQTELIAGGGYAPTASGRDVVQHGYQDPLAGGTASDDDFFLERSSDEVTLNWVPSGAFDDLDGDGCRELVVGGEWSASVGNKGAVWVFGTCHGSITDADAIAMGVEDDAHSFGGQVAVVADSDGDAVPELLVSARGHAMLDGSWRDEHGRVYLFLDPLNELDAADADGVFDTPAEAEWMSLGTRVCSADFDGDGLSDAAMSAPGYGYGYATLPPWGRGGAVFVAFAPFAAQTNLISMGGTPGDSVLVYTTSDDDGMLGHYLSCGGDFDGDGLPELLIGDEYEGRTTGRVYVQSPRATGSAAAESVGWRIDGTAPGELFGNGLPAEAGDLDGDGRDDIVVAALPSVGILDIFYGGSTATRTSADADARIEGPYSVALGDLNGDGLADIAAGQADDSTVAHWSGAVSILLGGSLEP